MFAVQYHCNTISVDEAAPLLVTNELPLVLLSLKEERLEMLALCVPCLFLEQAESMVCNLPQED